MVSNLFLFISESLTVIITNTCIWNCLVFQCTGFVPSAQIHPTLTWEICPAPVSLCSEPSCLKWPHHHCPAQLNASGLDLTIFSEQHILLLEVFIAIRLVITSRLFLINLFIIYAFKTEEGSWFHYRWMWATKGLLGIELKTTGKAANVLNYWPGSAAPTFRFFKKWFSRGKWMVVLEYALPFIYFNLYHVNACTQVWE